MFFPENLKRRIALDVEIDMDAEKKDNNVDICCPICDTKLLNLNDNIFSWPDYYGWVWATVNLPNYNNVDSNIKCLNCNFNFSIRFGSYGG